MSSPTPACKKVKLDQPTLGGQPDGQVPRTDVGEGNTTPEAPHLVDSDPEPSVTPAKQHKAGDIVSTESKEVKRATPPPRTRTKRRRGQEDWPTGLGSSAKEMMDTFFKLLETEGVRNTYVQNVLENEALSVEVLSYTLEYTSGDAHLKLILKKAPSMFMGRFSKLSFKAVLNKTAFFKLLLSTSKNKPDVYVAIMKEVYNVADLQKNDKFLTKWFVSIFKSGIVEDFFIQKAISILKGVKCQQVVTASADYLFHCEKFSSLDGIFLTDYTVKNLKRGNCTRVVMKIGFRIWSEPVLHAFLEAVLEYPKEATKYFWETLFYCKKYMRKYFLMPFDNLPKHLEPAVSFLLSMQVRLMELNGSGKALTTKQKRKNILATLNIKTRNSIALLFDRYDLIELEKTGNVRLAQLAFSIYAQYKSTSVMFLSQPKILASLTQKSSGIDLQFSPLFYVERYCKNSLDLMQFRTILMINRSDFMTDKKVKPYLLEKFCLNSVDQGQPTNLDVYRKAAHVAAELHFLFEPEELVSIFLDTLSTNKNFVVKECAVESLFRVINMDPATYSLFSPRVLSNLAQNFSQSVGLVAKQVAPLDLLSSQLLVTLISVPSCEKILRSAWLLYTPLQWVATTVFLFCSILEPLKLSEIERRLFLFGSLIPEEECLGYVVSALHMITSSYKFKHPLSSTPISSAMLIRALAYKLQAYLIVSRSSETTADTAQVDADQLKSLLEVELGVIQTPDMVPTSSDPKSFAIPGPFSYVFRFPAAITETPIPHPGSQHTSSANSVLDSTLIPNSIEYDLIPESIQPTNRPIEELIPLISSQPMNFLPLSLATPLDGFPHTHFGTDTTSISTDYPPYTPPLPHSQLVGADPLPPAPPLDQTPWFGDLVCDVEHIKEFDFFPVPEPTNYAVSEYPTDIYRNPPYSGDKPPPIQPEYLAGLDSTPYLTPQQKFELLDKTSLAKLDSMGHFDPYTNCENTLM